MVIFIHNIGSTKDMSMRCDGMDNISSGTLRDKTSGKEAITHPFMFTYHCNNYIYFYISNGCRILRLLLDTLFCPRGLAACDLVQYT